jgi:RecJ-like exonuclease
MRDFEIGSEVFSIETIDYYTGFPCEACRGTGEVQLIYNNPRYNDIEKCKRCGGSGTVLKYPDNLEFRIREGFIDEINIYIDRDKNVKKYYSFSPTVEEDNIVYNSFKDEDLFFSTYDEAKKYLDILLLTENK